MWPEGLIAGKASDVRKSFYHEAPWERLVVITDPFFVFLVICVAKSIPVFLFRAVRGSGFLYWATWGSSVRGWGCAGYYGDLGAGIRLCPRDRARMVQGTG